MLGQPRAITALDPATQWEIERSTVRNPLGRVVAKSAVGPVLGNERKPESNKVALDLRP